MDLSIDTIKEEAGKAAVDLGAITGGMIAANMLRVVTKKDDLVLNGSLAVAGFAGASMIKQPALKMLCLGASIFGTLRCLTIGVQTVTDPGTQGIAGLIPDSIKEKIKQFVPQLSGMDDDNFSGDDMENLTGDEVNLDDVGTIDVPYEEVKDTYSMSGLGDVEKLL